MIELIKKFWYVPVILLVLIFLWISYSAGTYNPKSDIVTQLVEQQLATYKAELDKQLTTEKEKYSTLVKEKDTLIQELNKKLSTSQSNYNTAKAEVAKLRREMENNVPPANITEARKRLEALNYTTF